MTCLDHFLCVVLGCLEASPEDDGIHPPLKLPEHERADGGLSGLVSVELLLLDLPSSALLAWAGELCDGRVGGLDVGVRPHSRHNHRKPIGDVPSTELVDKTERRRLGGQFELELIETSSPSQSHPSNRRGPVYVQLPYVWNP